VDLAFFNRVIITNACVTGALIRSRADGRTP
jgi:hypothetical protein